MRIFGIVLAVLVGCSKGPIDPGISWTMKTTETSTRASYWLRQGGDPVLSTGPLGSASSCILAETSGGSYESTSIAEYFTVHTALGYTEYYHPLVPNDDKYSDRLATVIQERTRGAASTEMKSTVYDPNSTMGNLISTSYADEAIETDASFYGIATDEYVVRFPLGNIWMDPESEVSANDVELLTRFEPDLGDIWASQNGNTVYIAGGIEQVSFAGAVKKASKVEVYEVGGLSGDGADIIDECFHVGLQQNQTNDPNSTNASMSTLFLDPNCTGTFEHVKVGTEWWYGGILVKEASTITQIEITNYGYEWYELDSTGMLCSRQTSETLDNPNAQMFVEYDLVTVEREAGVSQWVE